jgi:hypothetical protein
MEFFPSTSEAVTSPKGFIVVNTLAAVVITAIGLRLWLKRTIQKKARVGTFQMQAKDFGDLAETRRDVARTYAAGCIYLRTTDGATSQLKPLGLTPGVDREAVDSHIEAFMGAVSRALPELDVSPETFARLLPMLTVNPALGALSDAGEAPMLKQNRFLLRASTAAEAAGSLHCLTIGYVAAPPTGKRKPDEVLTVASPNLLEEAPAGDFVLTYALRRAEHTDLGREVTLHGVADVPVAA